MKCEKWSCRSVRHDRTPARPVTVTKMQRSRPAGKPDFSAMGCPCVWRNLSEQRCSARCVSGMFRKVDGGICRCWWRRVANRFAGSSFGDVSRSGADRDDRETQKARPEDSGRAFCAVLLSGRHDAKDSFVLFLVEELFDLVVRYDIRFEGVSAGLVGLHHFDDLVKFLPVPVLSVVTTFFAMVCLLI